MSSARNHGPGPYTTGDTQYNVRDAALWGATLAFAKPSALPRSEANTTARGSNGALLAATKVGTPVKGDHQSGSPRSTSRPNHSPVRTASKSNSTSSLRVTEGQFDRSPSPSNIAARLAAARHSPLRPVLQPTVVKSIMSEREQRERDILPPAGSVDNVLARFEPKKSTEERHRRKDSAGSILVDPSRAGTQTTSKSTDESSIPSTTSLVKMFEQNRPVTPTNLPTAPLHVTRSSPPPVRSPKPQRAFKLPPEPKSERTLQRVKSRTPPPVKTELKPRIQLPSTQVLEGAADAKYFTTRNEEPMKSPPIKQKPTSLAVIKTTVTPSFEKSGPTLQDARESADEMVSAPTESNNTADSPVSFKSAKEQQEVEEKFKPDLPPPRRSKTKKMDTVSAGNMTKPTAPLPIRQHDSPQSSVVKHSPDRFPPPRRPASSTGTSPSVYHNNYQRESVKEITKHMTGESLSSAIMGAALAASSRNVSPVPRPVSIEPLFPPRKQQHHHHHHHHHHHLHSPFRRSPSPQKQSPPKSTGKLRTTMRQEPQSSDDEDEAHEYKKKGTRIMGIKHRKHPNKHHEGGRRRWRDQITERERKRYEGVWAANKGIFLPSKSPSPTRVSLEDDPSLDVLNILVREIWSRSRLPGHVLEEVWDLVDGRGIGRLTRYEFVVGLWLIDQRLKGRKLPTRVSDSVWQSARDIGLKVKVHR